MQLNARFDEKGGRRTRNKKFLLTISLFCFSSVSFQIIKKKRFGATEPRRKNTLGGGGGKNFFKEIFSRTKNVSNQIDWLFWRIFHRAHTSPISDTIAIGKTAAIRGRAFSIPIHTPRTDDLKITMKKPINGARGKTRAGNGNGKRSGGHGWRAADGRVGAADSRHSAANLVRPPS